MLSSGPLVDRLSIRVDDELATSSTGGSGNSGY
jgi:hypothetical protein